MDRIVRDIGGRMITDAEWETFVAGELMPRFPDDYTVSDAKGQWRDGHSNLVHEPTKVVEIVHDGHTERRASGHGRRCEDP
jgi:hypothetical protein